MNLRQAISAMGYQEVRPGKWFKPVGHCLFEIKEQECLWTCWFKSASEDKLCIWAKKVINSEQEEFGDYLYQIKHAEAYYSKTAIGSTQTSFELLPAIEEMI